MQRTNYLSKFVASRIRFYTCNMHGRIKIFTTHFSRPLFSSLQSLRKNLHFYNASRYFLVTFSDPKLLPRPCYTIPYSHSNLECDKTHSCREFLISKFSYYTPCMLLIFEKYQEKKKHSTLATKSQVSAFILYLYFPNVAKQTHKTQRKEREKKINK